MTSTTPWSIEVVFDNIKNGWIAEVRNHERLTDRSPVFANREDAIKGAIHIIRKNDPAAAKFIEHCRAIVNVKNNEVNNEIQD